MKNSIKIFKLLFLALPLILAACTASPSPAAPTELPKSVAPTSITTAPAVEVNEPTPAAQPTQPGVDTGQGTSELTREDAQGNVTVVITPINIGQPGETLDFDVVLDTHSIDLSMDLSQLAILTTDSGKSVTPLKWDAPMGGHHVAGTLSFPASVDGVTLLDGAKSLTLTLQNVDAPERIFIWQLTTP